MLHSLHENLAHMARAAGAGDGVGASVVPPMSWRGGMSVKVKGTT